MSLQMSNMRSYKGLGGGLLELPIPIPTSPMAFANLESPKRRPRKAVGGVEKKGGWGKS